MCVCLRISLQILSLEAKATAKREHGGGVRAGKKTVAFAKFSRAGTIIFV